MWSQDVTSTTVRWTLRLASILDFLETAKAQQRPQVSFTMSQHTGSISTTPPQPTAPIASDDADLPELRDSIGFKISGNEKAESRSCLAHARLKLCAQPPPGHKPKYSARNQKVLSRCDENGYLSHLVHQARTNMHAGFSSV